MNLPVINIPITLPVELPELMHAPLVHFAIAIPVLILILEFLNTFMKKRAISALTFSLLIFVSVVLFGAYFTGKVDASNAFDALSVDGKELIKTHKLFGAYLFYVSLVLVALKLFNLTKLSFFKGLYILVLILFVAATLNQGKMGGKLVYEHGANVSLVTLAQDELFDVKEENEELQESIDKLKKELEKVKLTPMATQVKEEKVEIKVEDSNTTN